MIDFFGNLNTSMLQIRNKSLVIWGRYDGETKARMPQVWKKDAYSGEVGIMAQKRIRTAVELLLMSTPEKRLFNYHSQKYFTHRLSFITLTIPDEKPMIGLNDGHKLLLKPFIRKLNKNQKLGTYVWKAEYQKRNQLHYHITTPSFIDIGEIRNIWNEIIFKNGLMKSYINQYGNNNPPSTEIKEARKISDLNFYLQKEISKLDEYLEKSEELKKLKGKIWDCSLNLKGKKFPNFEMNEKHEVNIFNELLNGTISEKDCDNCVVIKTKRLKGYKFLTSDEIEVYRQYIESIRRPVYIDSRARKKTVFTPP